MASPTHDHAEIFVDLRSRGLHYRDDDPGDKIRGLVTDIAYDEGIVTIVCLDDGSTSMYTNHGGGIIGAGEHEHVAAVTQRVIDLAQGHCEELVPTEDESVPTAGDVKFFLLSPRGLLSVTADEIELDSRNHSLSPLFFAIQDVVTELGRVDPQL